jgi:hypothetical protein
LRQFTHAALEFLRRPAYGRTQGFVKPHEAAPCALEACCPDGSLHFTTSFQPNESGAMDSSGGRLDRWIIIAHAIRHRRDAYFGSHRHSPLLA